MPRASREMRGVGAEEKTDSCAVPVMMFHTREALVADMNQHAWQHVVEQTPLPNQFLVQNLLLLILLLKGLVKKLLLLKHYGAATPEKESSRLTSASTRTLR